MNQMGVHSNTNTSKRKGSFDDSSDDQETKEGQARRKMSTVEESVSTWESMRMSAEEILAREPLLEHLLKVRVLSHTSFGRAVAGLISDTFGGHMDHALLYDTLVCTVDAVYDGTVWANNWYSINDSVEEMCLADLTSILARDPACEGLVHAFLNFKGFRALAAHRMAHVLWRAGRREVALAIQSRCCEVFAVDIHPASRIGPGLMIDHATGLVIGETSTVGANCAFLHGVTLGSSGKEKGLRHPQIGNDVLIGCNASVLGYIQVGDNCKIGSGSIVLKPVPQSCTVVGNPARIVGKSSSTEPAASTMDHGLHDVVTADGRLFEQTWSSWSDFAVNGFEEMDVGNRGYLFPPEAVRALAKDLGVAPPASVTNAVFQSLSITSDSARINKAMYERLVALLGIGHALPAMAAGASGEWQEFSTNVSHSSSNL